MLCMMENSCVEWIWSISSLCDPLSINTNCCIYNGHQRFAWHQYKCACTYLNNFDTRKLIYIALWWCTFVHHFDKQQQKEHGRVCFPSTRTYTYGNKLYLQHFDCFNFQWSNLLWCQFLSTYVYIRSCMYVCMYVLDDFCRKSIFTLSIRGTLSCECVFTNKKTYVKWA